jgi:hypothetical protein
MESKQYAYKLLYEYSRILNKKSTDIKVIECALFCINKMIKSILIIDKQHYLVDYYLDVKNYLIKKHH